MWPAILGMTFGALPASKAGLAGGLVLGAAGVGNAAGPLLGGVLDDIWSWRAIFLLNVPVTGVRGRRDSSLHQGEADREHRRQDRLPRRRHGVGRPRRLAAGLRPGAGLGRLGRPAHRRPARPVGARHRHVRVRRAGSGAQRARPGRRDAQPRLHLFVRGDPVHVSGLLRDDALRAAVHAEGARLLADPDGPGDAPDDGRVRGCLVRRGPAV